MLQDVSVIKMDQLLETVQKIKSMGYRLAAMTCEKENEEYELVYHFDKDYSMKNIKVGVKKGDLLKSISKIYPAAFLIENETQDLFGFKFEGLTIDYQGRLYLTEDGPVAPLTTEKD